MAFDSPSGTSGGDAAGPPHEHDGRDESLISEVQAAADAAVAQARKVAATASAEARLNVAAAIAMASITMLGVSLLIVAWTFVVALGVWMAIDAGWPVAAALLTAALANVVAAILCRVWYGRLSRNIGFSRTLGLLFAGGRTPREHS